MSSTEMILFYSTIAIATILSGILFYFKNISKKTYLLLVGIILVIEGIFIGIRWYNTGHPPMFGTFEATISASWMLLFLAVLIDRKAQFGRIVIPFVVLTLFYGVLFDKAGSIGRRYARNDEAGTPYCVTVDNQSLEDKTVTIRERDTTTQRRVQISELTSVLKQLIQDKTVFNTVGLPMK